MSVDKTSGINQNLIGKILTNQNLVKSGDAKKASSGVSSDTQILAGGDKVEISSEARDLHKALSSLKDEVKEMPDTRKEKIEMVKARIDAGFYEKEAVTKEVARSIKDSGLL